MSTKVRWGILGTGKIARVFAKGLTECTGGYLYAVGSRTKESADKFGDEFKVEHRYGSYETLLSDNQVDVVYISTPHPMHAEWAIKAAAAGKHILCEKPLTLNHAEAMAVIEAAREYDVFLMEAFMYRCHPQTAKIAELIREKTIGDIRLIQAAFSFQAPFDSESRLFKNALGGGGILDVGCYCTSMARLVAGAAVGQPFVEPIEVKGSGHIGEGSRVDEYATATLKFQSGILAQLAAGVRLTLENHVRIYGTEGSLFIPQPWFPNREGVISRIVIQRRDEETPRELYIENKKNLYAIEADTVAQHLEERQVPAISWADTLGNMKTLDRWREAVSLTYDSEKAEAQLFPVHRRPLSVRPDHRMKYGQISGIPKPISRLAMGVDNQTFMPHAAVMFDDFFERGGNFFDTAYVYAAGVLEKNLGQWIKNRGVRERVVILDKGAHTPFCNPVDLTKQLLESLERLQTDYVDLYMLHRDNPEIPADEFIDVLNEQKEKGRVSAFGASNWSIARLEAANEYAKSRGLSGFAAVSNNFSLARMVQPVWPGCISSSDKSSSEWFRRTQMPLVAWSSQARGFFTRAYPNDRSDEELVRCWYSDENFQRLERAQELAAKRGVLPINIALAYVLCQPFPTFALIGPRTLEETRLSLPALEIELTSEELKWLNLETR
jgi:predicted dehydrogenase/aryl-alcohol dehydrogenase-like predicted oxidoreductase